MMDKRDLYLQVAGLHVGSIDQGFLATLGVGVVSQMYRAIDEARESVLLVEVRDGRVVGFVSGGVGMGPIYKRMLRHPVALTASLLPSILRPRRMLRILEILRYSRGNSQPAGLPEAELLSMAVSPECRGQQVAEQLYTRLVDHFKASGIPDFKITVGEALAPAHRFYQRMGAKPAARTQVHAGESSSIYIHHVG
jgi:ribosomal protein S18 acetylase RimI-like enzyme